MQRKTHPHPRAAARFAALAAILAIGALGKTASASVFALPHSLAAEALSESVPTAYSPTDIHSEDYVVEWEDGPAPDSPNHVEARVEPMSLEWVRVSEILVIPRARLTVEIGGHFTGGSIRCGGFSQALDPGSPSTHIPIALISGPANPCTLSLARDGDKPLTRTLHIRFQPPTSTTAESRHLVDPSCSHYGVDLTPEQTSGARSEWMYVGCRLVSANSEQSRTSSLEVYLFWDGVGQSIEINGVATPASSVSLWALRLAPEPGQVLLRGGGRELTLHYAIPKHLHRGGAAVGAGLYSYAFESTTHTEHNVAPILTLYGGYMISDSMRIVAFDATAFNDTLYTDMGAYLSTEYARVLDRRVGVYVMLGAHAIGFSSQGEYYVRLGAPQGMEAVFSDAFLRGADMRAGAFVYPNIGGTEYYNAWLRWGRSSLFMEINYISWQENLGDKGLFYSRSLGVTVGIPLFQFL